MYKFFRHTYEKHKIIKLIFISLSARLLQAILLFIMQN